MIRSFLNPMIYYYRKMPEYQGCADVTAETKCWGIIVAYDLNDGQTLAGKEDRLEQFQNMNFSEAERKAEELNRQLKDNI